MFADGNLTGKPMDSVYSSVVSLKGLKITILLSELKKFELWSTDVGNSYLNSYTDEKISIIEVPEFGDREGHTLIIRKELYGLKSSGLRWWERFSDILSEIKFFPYRSEDDMWMIFRKDNYEYISRYVYYLKIVSKYPNSIIKYFTDNFGLTLKGTGPISYHLGCDFFRDPNNVLCMDPLKYIDRMIESYIQFLGINPRESILHH